MSTPVLRPGDGPAHTQIERWLMAAIADGELSAGDRLPGERDLSAQLGVSRMTLRHALAALERRGLLVRTQGRSGGAFVAEPRIECDLTGLAGFTAQMRRADLAAHARMLAAVTIPADAETAAALELDEGDLVHEVSRVRSAGGAPVVLERSRFPAQLFPDLLEQDLSGSLYELLEHRYGMQPRTALEHLEPLIAGAAEASELGIAQGAPLMLIERTAHTAAGVAVEYAHDLFRPDRVRISVRSQWSGG